MPELSTYNVTHQESKHIDTYSVRCHDFTVPLIRHGNYEVKSSNGNKYNVFCSQPDRKPVNISIFGSCISRDCLRLFPAEAFALKSYIARQSVISAVSKPVQIDMDKIKLESKFQKRSVFSDFTKDTFDILKSDGSDWLILDLIDERFQLVEISGSYATKSSEAVRSGIIPSNAATLSKVKKENEYYVGKHSVREYIECFCKELLKIYAPDHIVIHQVFALDNYYSKAGDIKPYPQDNIAFSRILNELLGYMYCVLRELLPQAHVIDCSTLYHGSEEHQWGLTNTHFEDDYYAEVINQLYNIIL